VALAELQRMKDKVAIAGIGTTPQGIFPGRDGNDLAADAFRLALDDCGLTKADVDGLITCRSYGGLGIDTQMAQLLGMNPHYSATLDYGTCNFSLHLAAMAIAAGFADVVACMYGTNQRSNRNYFADARDDAAPYGYFNIAGPASLALRRHMALYGTTEEQMSAIAVTFRQHALLNPLAYMKTPITKDDYLNSRYIVAPLHLFDMCLITDGGSCLIVTSAERARDMKKPPVYLMGMAENTGLRFFQNDDQLMRPFIERVAEQIYPSAGISRDDIDVLYIQDPTSVWPLQMLEWYGFCGIGEGGTFIQDGRIGLGGELPLNTNGGQLSESYMWGWLHIPEAVRQLRGEAGPRQVPGAEIAQYCSTMAFQKAASTILRR
jgi:acetyl-CoA acetyltransferase